MVTKTTTHHKVAEKHSAPVKHGRYTETIGRRKTAGARVRITPSKEGPKKHEIIVNGKPYTEYFALKRNHKVVYMPFEEVSGNFHVTVLTEGGGQNAQAEAIRLGIARALVTLYPEFRTKLKALGYLKRDPRMVERKKYGSRKARRPQQWRKR